MGTTDQYLILGLSLLGGLGLILVGLKFLSESVQILSGRCIQWVLNAITQNTFICLVAGGLIAFLVQSGITTSLMAVSFAGSGLLGLGQLSAILLGSNLGTLMTTWFFIVDSGNLGLYFLGIGAVPMLYSRYERVAYLGKFIFSIGLLLMGYHLLNQGLSEPMIIKNVVEKVMPPDQHPTLYYLAVMVTTITVTLFVRSTVAMIAMFMALVSVGLISAEYASYGVFGANVAMTIPVIAAVRSAGTLPRRGAAFHFLVKVLSLILLVTFFPVLWYFNFDLISLLGVYFAWDLLRYGDVAMVPMAHISFNLFAITIGMILFVPLKLLVTKLVRGTGEKEMQRLQLLGRISHLSPSLALEQAYQEVKKLAAMVESVLQLTRNVVTGKEDQEQEALDKTIKYEAITDNIQDELLEFLAHVMEVPLSERQGRQVKGLMRMTDELESVADNCKYIVEHYKRLKDTNANYTKALSEYVSEYFNEILTYYEWVFSEIAEAGSDDSDIASRDYKAKSMDLKGQQLDLLKQINKKAKEPELARSITDILVNLNQVRSHTINIHEAHEQF